MASKMKCDICGVKNIFELLVRKSSSQILRVLCRNHCWDKDSEKSLFIPLIKDGVALEDWVLAQPSSGSIKIKPKLDVIDVLENSHLEGDYQMTYEKAAKVKESLVQLPIIPVRFKSEEHFHKTFSAHLQEEMKASFLQEKARSRKLKNLQVCWISAETLMVITPNNKSFFENAPVHVSLPESGWKCEGFVEKTEDRSSVKVHLSRSTNPPTNKSEGFTVKICHGDVRFDRMATAIENSADSSRISKILLNPTPVAPKANALVDLTWSPSLPTPNDSQVLAVRSALASEVCLIQGPPGCGKTVCAAQILMNLPYEKVLLCAPSNSAADHLAGICISAGIPVVRMMARVRERDTKSPVYEHTLYALISRNSKEYAEAKDSDPGVGRGNKEARRFTDSLEIQLLKSAGVVITTCIAAGDKRLKKLSFDTVIFDESTQCVEPETLVALGRRPKRLILIGDHKQLPPVVLSKPAEKAGYKRSLFERLIDGGMSVVRLNVQYRMHPTLAIFSSTRFYDSEIKSGITAKDRESKFVFFPNPKIPTFFYHIPGGDEIGVSGTSYVNRNEVDAVKQVVTDLVSKVPAKDVAVISPYNAQRDFLVGKLPIGVEISSVDGFQGREKEYIVITTVRANQSKGLGFLGDERRMNVMLTRARKGLVIIGCAETFMKTKRQDTNGAWKQLLLHYAELEAIFESTWGNLKPYILPGEAAETDTTE
jgi:regulator of nonsense transcripts 1